MMITSAGGLSRPDLWCIGGNNCIRIDGVVQALDDVIFNPHASRT